ncbi:DUF5655 domain-containing protein [Pseudonocardia endophytica]|uniref:DUF5655 domain-containing protein n=1 Tax=Pseudonocardia endophytica TaxID=401976 RepID=A0A4R1HUZ4_PSEEN|nr:DUF5655 domain-containing protein [Pseudonocardia endophytica]TCK25231.1 hypothetical protein EV378_1034 [Pseudonocardia endophytica]
MLSLVESTWDELTAPLDADDLALFTLYRTFCRGLPDVEEQVHTSQVQYRRTRIFTSGYVKSHYLEIGLELMREASHPRLRTAFPTSKTVIMHRITLRDPEQFDDDLRALIEEARTTVGPGLRRGR